MKTPAFFTLALTFVSLSVFCQTAPTIKTIDIAWLTGEQPKLLSMMANSPVSHEELNGTNLSMGTLLGGWHAQAIGQYGDYVYVAFSDGKLLDAKTLTTKKEQSETFGKLWIYNTKTKEGKLKELEKGYAHPCSIQITGGYMTIALEAAYGTNQMIGIERNESSIIPIYDLKQDPFCSVEVGRIVQGGMNSGGAGLTFHPGLKCWFMLVDQDFSNGRVAIYQTENEKLDSWKKEPISYYPRFGSGAGLNLITASDHSIWGLYYDTNDERMPTLSNLIVAGNEVKLFKLIEPGGTPVSKREVNSQVVSIGAPLLKSAGELLANQPGMRFGASIRYEGEKLELLMCQRNMTNLFKIDRTIMKTGDRTQVMFINFAKARGEISVSSPSNPSQNKKIQNVQTESWTEIFASPVKVDVNYMKLSAKSFGSLSVPKWTDAFDGSSSAPLTLTYIEGEDDIKGKMVEFQTTKTTDSKK